MTVDGISSALNSNRISEPKRALKPDVPSLPLQPENFMPPEIALGRDALSPEDEAKYIKSLLSYLYPGADKLREPSDGRTLTLEAFNKAGGSFVNGKACYSNGENFTGVILSSTEDNKRIVMGYAGGLLRKVEKFAPDDSLILRKNYSYDKNGKLNNVSSVYNDGTTCEVSLNRKGIIVRRNDKISKAYYKDERKNLQRVSNFDDLGRLSSVICVGPGADYPLKKYSYYGDTKLTKKIECYTESGQLRKLIEYTENGASKTILCPNQKNEKVIKEVRVAQDGPLPYDADKMVINGIEDDACSITYFKDDKEIVSEKFGAYQKTGSDSIPYEECEIRNKAGLYYRKVLIDDKRTGEVRKEIHYSGGARDILLSGRFGSSDMEVQFRDSKDEVTGYFKRTRLGTYGYSDNKYGSILMDNVKEEYLDADKKLISGKETIRKYSSVKQN